MDSSCHFYVKMPEPRARVQGSLDSAGDMFSRHLQQWVVVVLAATIALLFFVVVVAAKP